ncbi:MAG TPA: glycosyltransferase [Terracidiphilus sp.]|nr:glycosyltransferase [Terracidiphilus sp.]
MAPRLSIILPVYNGMPYLPKSVESILGQSFTDFAFIIVNDGSTDGSAEFLGTLKDPRIAVISQANAGQGVARNTALRHCRSEYVAVMDQDDISKPERLLSQLEYLDAHPDIVLLGTQIEFLIGSASQRAFKSPIDHDEIESRLLKGRAGICHPSLMYRTAAAIACGGYPTEGFGEDIDLCLRMLEHGRAANLDRILFQYRLHPAQASLARCKELISANSYAAYNATCRRKGQPMTTSGVFLRDASFFTRLRWSLEAWELIQYRTARINLASGRPVIGTLRLGLLGIVRPFVMISRVAHALRSR